MVPEGWLTDGPFAKQNRIGMWFFVLALLTLMVVDLLTGIASASPLDCESIHDADQRNYCRAVSKRQKSYCEFIKNHDLRYRCRAEVLPK